MLGEAGRSQSIDDNEAKQSGLQAGLPRVLGNDLDFSVAWSAPR